MVNGGFTSPERIAAERRMILSYAPADARGGLAALLSLDDALGAVLRGTREPMIGQMRLTWWHDALSALDYRPPPAEPVLRALAAEVLPRVTGATVARLAEGWEELLDAEPLDDGRLGTFATLRGAGLFAAAGAMLGATAGDPLEEGGRGWALSDLAANLSDASARTRAEALAAEPLAAAAAVRWSRRARPLGAMVHLARLPADATATRVVRALGHRLTGR